MNVIQRIVLFCFVFCLFSASRKASCQTEVSGSVGDPFKLDNFSLVYGNANFNIHDFLTVDKYKV